MKTENEQYIFGTRAVIEAIGANRVIDKILIKYDLSSDVRKEITDIAQSNAIPVQRVPLERLNRITRKNHQGVIAFIAAVDYWKLEDLIPSLYEDRVVPFVVVLDGVTDVRNFGAIARTCECAGVNAIVIPEKNSVCVNADAVKTSAGALNYLPVCREKNVVSAIEILRNNGFAIVGSSDRTETDYTSVDYTVPTAIVLGGEDNGISTDVKNMCDRLVRIPEFGEINSLNVSVAGGILIYEVVRQRLKNNLMVE